MGVALGRSGVGAEAAVPLRPRNRLHHSERAYAKRSISAIASAISGISGVGANPSSAGAETAWASRRRFVN